MGKVEAINLRDTTIRTFQGEMVIIPNKEVFQNPIENYSLLGKRRIDLTVGVSYGEDLKKVMDVTLNAVKGIEDLSDEDETTMFYKEFGDSSINFVIRLWINTRLINRNILKSGVKQLCELKKPMTKMILSIPFPIRTLDFGIKGGATLKEMPINILKEKDNEDN